MELFSFHTEKSESKEGKRAGEEGAEKGEWFFFILRSHKVRRVLRMGNYFLFILTSQKVRRGSGQVRRGLRRGNGFFSFILRSHKVRRG